VVERRRSHADENVGRLPKLRLWEVGPEVDLLDAAVGSECKCSQIVVPNGIDIFD
jgi:hypothetical protein